MKFTYSFLLIFLNVTICYAQTWVDYAINFPNGSIGISQMVIVSQNEAYATGGSFNFMSWDGTSWSRFNNLTFEQAPLMDFKSPNEIYFTNNKSSPTLQNPNNIVKWNGSILEVIDVPNPTDRIYGIKAIHQNEIYCYGKFSTDPFVRWNSLGKWDGLNWSIVGYSSSISTPYGTRSLGTPGEIINGNKIFLRHDHYSGRGNYSVKKWDGSSWQVYGGATLGPFSVIEYLDTDKIYIGNPAETSSDSPQVLLFDTSMSSSNSIQIGDLLADLPGFTANYITNMKVVSANEIYVLGDIRNNNTGFYSVLKWDGFSWDELGSIEARSFGGSMYIDQNNTLYVSGDFFSGKKIKMFDLNTLNTQGFEPSSSLNFYPNPSKGIVYFNAVIQEIKLRDIHGKVLQSFKNTDKIDISMLNQGFYILELQLGNNKTTKKLLKN